MSRKKWGVILLAAVTWAIPSLFQGASDIAAGSNLPSLNHPIAIVGPQNHIQGEKPVPGNTNGDGVQEQADIGVAENRADENGVEETIPSLLNAHRQRERDDEQKIMEEALELVDQSQVFWKKGDIENALDLLDRSYAIILDTDGDPNIARQKDDLRLLIAKKILAIYTSMQTATSGMRSEIPLPINEDVEKEIRSFQGIERSFFIQSYHRSFLYRPIIVRELKKAGLPEELSWLPLVESGFKVSALSRARALGLWQFIPSTGYKYGLNRDDWVDERMDVEKSTRAAIGYLKDLHEMFGDWLSVLAAYNCGEGRVLRVISRQHLNYLDRFWDLYYQLPNETARYVPRFLATLHIIKDPGKFGMDFNENRPENSHSYLYENITTNKPMRLSDIAKKLEISEEELSLLNTELRHKMTPDRTYELKVPPGFGEKLAQVMDEVPRWEKSQFASRKGRTIAVRHKVKKGETMESIARRYKVSLKTLLANNRLSSPNRLAVGQRLNIPVYSVSPGREQRRQTKGSDTGTIRYVVREGDTLSSIAHRHEVPLAQIRKTNGLEGDRIRIGQALLIASAVETTGASSPEKDTGTIRLAKGRSNPSSTTHQDSGSESRTYVVKKGDTLSKIANSNAITLKDLLELNKMQTTKSPIYPGQLIVVK